MNLATRAFILIGVYREDIREIRDALCASLNVSCVA